jgi:hypothetical protein
VWETTRRKTTIIKGPVLIHSRRTSFGMYFAPSSIFLLLACGHMS